ncbi:LuxR C-terminal-related transcriptional regulator [Mesorhizobium japonicum]|uniref:Two-component regulator n=1 Tax=Mesorhizobium japonicum (strain LMG 29417 / CECT 9101 / MAFF 303099) TaxID=266835 RepID=Q988Y3_RHILO|nr:response regulator transcription factor [Mesorhizobium japonicum]BAB52814.1 two-component regulator [Mesorhizobium japonicum MAFF 303099]
MRLVVVTPIRLFGDALTACFLPRTEVSLQATVSDLTHLRILLRDVHAEIVLIDVTQGIALDEVRSIASQFPGIALVALGLQEQRQDVIRCGRAGFSGYVGRDASVEDLCCALANARCGKLSCSAEISGGLLRALFEMERNTRPAESTKALTQREGEVLQLIGNGLSNKEIALDLSVSVATVKHHVHNILQKLKLPRRTQAMRRVREAPWIAASPPLDRYDEAD